MNSSLRLILPLVAAFMLVSCTTEQDKYVEAVNRQVRDIDSNRRVKILEDDYHVGDTLHIIRGYYMDNVLLKLVSITQTSHMERDDYFYFDHRGQPIFTGHLVNEKDAHDAAEYKYYYKDNAITASMYWEDHYQPGRQFPHEHFDYFNPNLDSLQNMEKSRLAYFRKKLEEEGFSVQDENENLEANSRK